MAAWEWVVLTLAVVGALQLLALRYALRARSADGDGRQAVRQAVERDRVEQPDPVEQPDLVEQPDPVEHRGSASDGHRCPHCGAENDPEFTYCRRCVSFLGR
jgi:hypothetical protein